MRGREGRRREGEGRYLKEHIFEVFHLLGTCQGITFSLLSSTSRAPNTERGWSVNCEKEGARKRERRACRSQEK